MPPGPVLMPILGNILSLASKDSLKNLAQLRKRYGDVYALYIGKELTVFLNGFEVINDSLLKKGSVFVRRPDSPFARAINHYPGIVAANDKLWKEQRTFTLRALQQLCFKNRSQHIETVILEEATKLLDKIESINGPIDPKHYFAISFANVVSNVLMSRSFDLDDAEFINFLNKCANNSRNLPRLITLINCFPFLTKLPGDALDIKSVFAGIFAWFDIFKKYTADRKWENAENDFVDLYMQSVYENEANGKSQTITEKQLKITTFDLIIAGSDTSATTVRWLLLYLLQDPMLEAKLHFEIDDVIGKTRAPSLEDRSKMPYLEATIMEALRLANVAPLAVPHSVADDVIFKGYLIPKDTTIIANLNSIMMDPNIWIEPGKFNPERFLTPDGKTLKIPEEFIPFSLGPRSCVGETLAKMEMFLFVASLLQRFKLEYVGSSPPPVKGNLGVTYNPDPYEIRFIKR
ncbi:MAG: cytochrome P450 [Candidatus Thiodiazotropha sp.]